MSGIIGGIWSSVENPDKWFEMTYQSQAARQMLGGPSPREIQAADDAAQDVANRALAQRQQATAAAKRAEEAAERIAADQARADEEAAEQATLLSERRRRSLGVATSPQGILGQAPVRRKTLLGE